MMRTIVITGGTDGMGAALARHYLTAGDRVIVIGRSRPKFDALVAAVTGEDPSAAARAEFIAADLSLVADARRVTGHLRAQHQRVDALVLAASFIRRHRQVTAEGHEASWALFFLSKYLLVTGLAPLLRASGRPVIVNTAVPGARPDAVDFADLEMTHGFTLKRPTPSSAAPTNSSASSPPTTTRTSPTSPGGRPVWCAPASPVRSAGA